MDKALSSVSDFSLGRIPKIEFGIGKRALLSQCIKTFGSHILLVKGNGFLEASSFWQEIVDDLSANNITWEVFTCCGEPSPVLVDEAVVQFSRSSFDAVVGIGGGSVLDAAKAIAGLIKVKMSVMDFLEGVGPELPYKGPSLPFIAMPTTAGTGSEATKNSVLSFINRDRGFKKSFRDEQLVAQVAIVDPEFLLSCPPNLIAANGMDALTQLLESFVSIKANEVTDALAYSGLRCVFQGLIPSFDRDSEDRQSEHLSNLAYGSLLSGITLAQVGLGSVHGLASPLGAFFPIPHGEVCGTLLATATEINLHALKERAPESSALTKYANIGRLISGDKSLDDKSAQQYLVEQLKNWETHMQMPNLSSYGVTDADLNHIVSHARGSSMKTNPIVLTDDEIKSILIKRMK